MDDLFKDIIEIKSNENISTLIALLSSRQDKEIKFITATVIEMLKHIKKGQIF